MLKCLRELVSAHYPYEKYAHVLDLYFDTFSKNPSVKIQEICLLSIKKFLDLFHQTLSGHPKNFNRAITLIRSKVQELDCDKLIKKAICKCLAEVF